MIETITRTILFYFFILFMYRIMGKREIGQLGVIDLIVSILIAELAALSIEKTNQSVWMTIVPMLLLVGLELILGYLIVKSRIFNKIFGGKPTLIINNGKIIYKNLINQRYSIDDLLLELRKNGIYSIEDVEYAFLEMNGKLSIFKYKSFKLKSDLPMPLIIEGVIQRDVLKDISRSEEWLLGILDRKGICLDDIFYSIYNKKHLYIIKKS